MTHAEQILSRALSRAISTIRGIGRGTPAIASVCDQEAASLEAEREQAGVSVPSSWFPREDKTNES